MTPAKGITCTCGVGKNHIKSMFGRMFSKEIAAGQIEISGQTLTYILLSFSEAYDKLPRILIKVKKVAYSDVK